MSNYGRKFFKKNLQKFCFYEQHKISLIFQTITLSNFDLLLINHSLTFTIILNLESDKLLTMAYLYSQHIYIYIYSFLVTNLHSSLSWPQFLSYVCLLITITIYFPIFECLVFIFIFKIFIYIDQLTNTYIIFKVALW